MKSKFLAAFFTLILATACSKDSGNNAMDDFDPTAEDAKKQLEEMDKANGVKPRRGQKPSCHQKECKVFALVDKATQKLILFIDGEQTHEWAVSTGKAGHETPDMDTYLNGRIYRDRYDSNTYPSNGNGYKRKNEDGTVTDLGNMPYAVFLKHAIYKNNEPYEPFAIHGTSAIRKLGQPDSHGCVRIHPDNAKFFNQLVTEVGTQNVWVTVQ